MRWSKVGTNRESHNVKAQLRLDFGEQRMKKIPGAKAILVSTFVLDDEQLAAVGCVAVESTYSDHVVEGIIWDLCRLKEAQGKFLTDRLQVEKKLELMSDLWKPLIKDQAKLDELTRITSGLKEANNNRNTIVHGRWHQTELISIRDFMKGERKPSIPFAIKRRLKSAPIMFSAESIHATAQRIAELTGELWDFAANSGIRQP